MPNPADDATTKLVRAGLNLIQQALSIYDSDLRLAACNGRFQTMFDLPNHLVTPGARFEDTIRFLVERGEYGAVEDHEAAVSSRVEMARAFEPHYMERARPNGRWISVEGAPLPEGGWVTVYTDITEIKLQENLLRARTDELSQQLVADAQRLAQANRALASTNAMLEEAKRELTEMEARTRLTAEMMPAHIARIDRGLTYTFSNRGLPAILPGRPREILGLHARAALGAEAFARIRPSLDRALAGHGSVLEFGHEESGRRIRVAFTPDRDEAGQVSGVYILSTDVTEEAQARAAAMQARKRELAAQLTSGLAHDFSNLLTIILGLQARLGRLAGLPPQAADLIEGTVAAARRGGALLDRIAAISGHRSLRPVRTDMGKLLRELQILTAPALPDGIAIEIDHHGLADSSLMIDTGALHDALVNLVLNARDAIGQGPGRIRITARALRDTWLELVVSDSGPGFSDEALLRATEPFFTTKGEAGSGLGLAMVYDHVKLAGGTLRLANAPAGGAVLTLRLPLRRAVPAAAPRLVLLVEDTEEIRTDIREQLRSLGHSVIEAAQGEEALALADLPEIDTVLSDITLPGGLSGLALAETLRSRGHRADLRLMTSLPAGNPVRRRAEETFPVLAKPFASDMLAEFLGTERAA